MAAAPEIVEGTMPVNLSFFQERSIGLTSQASTKCKGHKVEYSHKLTEKRRRDRMNISMSEIAQLLPSSSDSKQLEKAEILEKTIIYIKKLQEITGKQDLDSEKRNDYNLNNQGHQEVTTTNEQAPSEQPEVISNYCNGFKDCIKEVFHCLTNVEAMDLQQPCFRRLMGHLQQELQLMSGNSDETCNGGTDSSPSKVGHHSLSCKRTYTGEASSSENFLSKRMREDDPYDSNGSYRQRPQEIERSLSVSCESDHYNCHFAQETTIPNKEKSKVSAGVGSSLVRNDSPYSHMESSAVDKGKDISSNGNISDRDVDGSRCGSENSGGNHKLLNSSLDMPFVATPISPRTPYVASPYTAATYALHPSGTHYLPVVLHLPVVPPFAEVKGVRLNSSPNGHMAALNCMRMGSFQYPCFPYGIPLTPQSMMGMSGLRNSMGKQEPAESQKQCEAKTKEMDSSSNDDESTSVNVCSSTDKLYQ